MIVNTLFKSRGLIRGLPLVNFSNAKPAKQKTQKPAAASAPPAKDTKKGKDSKQQKAQQKTSDRIIKPQQEAELAELGKKLAPEQIERVQMLADCILNLNTATYLHYVSRSDSPRLRILDDSARTAVEIKIHVNYLDDAQEFD